MEKVQSIGGLYKKVTKSGKEFLKGSIEINGQKVKIVVWPNGHKKEDKHPDFVIQEDTWKPEQKADPQPESKSFVDNQEDLPF